jgi:hypothetical protein
VCHRVCVRGRKGLSVSERERALVFIMRYTSTNSLQWTLEKRAGCDGNVHSKVSFPSISDLFFLYSPVVRGNRMPAPGGRLGDVTTRGHGSLTWIRAHHQSCGHAYPQWSQATTPCSSYPAHASPYPYTRRCRVYRS